MAEALSVEGLPTARPAGRAGHETWRTIQLAVPDMHCGGCMRKVEQALLAVPGVASARTNLSAKRVAIVAPAGIADAEHFIELLRRVGFASALLVDHQPDTRAKNDDFLKRLGVAGFAAANIMLMSVAVWSGHAGDMPESLQTLFHWLSAMIALPSIAYAGQPFFSSARRALARRRLNMDVPISLGVGLATAMSLYQTMRGSDQVYFDAAITLLFFLLVGRALDERMRQRAASAAENLLGLQVPSTSVIRDDGRVVRVSTSDVTPGQRILVAAGERIPVDLHVVTGGTEVDESLITGESRPRRVLAGDRLYCGTINLSAPLEGVATAVADNTLLAEIARLIATAEQARGRYVRLADRAARLYAPAVHVLGATTFLGWMLAGYGWEPALTAAIAVLIITCPCALALAVPAVQVVATGRLFRSGVLVKVADGLERLAEVDTIVFDKTGTLTLGEPRVTNSAEISDASLAQAASLAQQSRHPYARAVVEAARERALNVPLRQSVVEMPGAGLIANVDGIDVRLGSAIHCGVSTQSKETQSIWFREGAKTPVEFGLTDPLRLDARETIATLSRSGYRMEILSGDRKDAVAEVARAIGIDAWRAEQRPEEKLDHIGRLTAAGRQVLMVGDGLNDAPALAAGHASMSPANAADISQASADAVLQGARLGAIVETLTVAKAARRRALENFAIALGYNCLFVPLAVVGWVTPLTAAIAMSASSIAVTLNALRLSTGKAVPL